jgi:para-aminobenzoate synthetase/4-amino-4-deoxychorismate lyase
MALIAEVEGVPRGVYCGAIGWVAPPSAAVRASFNVAIRTVVLDRARRTATYGVGGGITWSSSPSEEERELHNKASILTGKAEVFSLFETLALLDGKLRNLDRHLDRIVDSAGYFGFDCDREALRAGLLAAAEDAACDRARVRLVLHRNGGFRVAFHPYPAGGVEPVRLALSALPVDAADPFLAHKTTRREVYRVRAAEHPEADDVVLVNGEGFVTETTIANLAIHLDGAWWTPPVGDGCLPGVERGRLLDEGVLRERSLSVAELMAADDLAVVSSLRGWRPATLRFT